MQVHSSRRVGRWAAGATLMAGLALATACAGPAVSGGRPAAVPAQAVVGASGVQQVTVRVGEGVRFEPSTIAVKAGQPVQVTLQSTGGGEHDFALDEGVARPFKVAVRGGETASGTFTIERPGTYEFYCSVPGHALVGMRGTITVE